MNLPGIKPEPYCPNCKRQYPPGYTAELRRRRGQNISRTIQAARARGQKFGRVRSLDYEVIYKLRDQRFSIMKIAKEIGRSKGTVQYALKVRKDAESKNTTKGETDAIHRKENFRDQVENTASSES